MALKIIIADMVNVPEGVTDGLIPSGGTTGQVIVKSSNTDFAVGWTNDLPLASLADATAESKLIGRGQGSSGGAFGEITIGTGLEMVASQLRVSGASGAFPSQVPSWTYGSTADGHFNSNNAAPGLVTILTFADEILGDDTKWNVAPGTHMILKNGSTIHIFAFVSAAPDGGNPAITVTYVTSTNSSSWDAGEYTLSFRPVPQVLDTDVTLNANSDSKIASQKAVKAYADAIAANLTISDSGWTANASVGDKTQSVADYSGSGIDGTMAAALELVSSGLGTALQQDESRIRELIKKVQAIETVLVANKHPNA